MQIVNVNEANNEALDWLVTRCLGFGMTKAGWVHVQIRRYHKYTTNWALGGPILESHHIVTKPHKSQLYGEHIDAWMYPHKGRDTGYHNGRGPTYLVAGLRCYIISVLGHTVEVPNYVKVK